MLRPEIPEKAMKCFYVRKGGPTRIIDNECIGVSWRIGGLIMSRPIMIMGI